MSQNSFSLKQMLETLNTEQKIYILPKLNKLNEYLQTTYQLQTRDDSRLVWNYLLHMPESELFFVCRELWYTKLLYEYSDYQDICKKTIPFIKYSLMKGHEEHALTPQQSWEHIQNFVLPSIQINCMGKLIEKMNNIK